MCAIVDVNNCHKIFGRTDVQTPAGKFFLDWLESERGRVVIGGTQMKREIDRVGRYDKWLKTAIARGRVRQERDNLVDAEANTLGGNPHCRSDDQHLLALARIAGARLLFTEDPDLQEDFRNHQIIANPRGKVYSTRIDHEVSKAHQRLLDPRYAEALCADN
jgi:hypothetical protein